MPTQMQPEPDRRDGEDRRQRHWYALWLGNSARRRRAPRRGDERSPAAVDWHHSQWLAVAMLILLLSAIDAVLTLALVDRGATEANPLMAPLVGGSGHGFALWKLGLTIFGVVTLVVYARLHLIGRLRVGSLLYLVLALYVALIAYECHLLLQDGTRVISYWQPLPLDYAGLSHI
jgi:Domain of unknown function (DUF5658)